jgi:hypothetical protein
MLYHTLIHGLDILFLEIAEVITYVQPPLHTRNERPGQNYLPSITPKYTPSQETPSTPEEQLPSTKLRTSPSQPGDAASGSELSVLMLPIQPTNEPIHSTENNRNDEYSSKDYIDSMATPVLERATGDWRRVRSLDCGDCGRWGEWPVMMGGLVGGSVGLWGIVVEAEIFLWGVRCMSKKKGWGYVRNV